MSFDAGVVSFGLAQVLLTLFHQPALVAYSFWAMVLAIDLLLLIRYLRDRNIESRGKEKVAIPAQNISNPEGNSPFQSGGAPSTDKLSTDAKSK